MSSTPGDNFRLNTNTKCFWIQYQYQFQYLRIWKGIPISISIPQKSKLNNNTNINTQIFQIQYQAQYNTEVSRYFAISRQYQKNSSRYRAFTSCAFSKLMKMFCFSLVIVDEVKSNWRSTPTTWGSPPSQADMDEKRICLPRKSKAGNKLSLTNVWFLCPSWPTFFSTCYPLALNLIRVQNTFLSTLAVATQNVN